MNSAARHPGFTQAKFHSRTPVEKAYELPHGPRLDFERSAGVRRDADVTRLVYFRVLDRDVARAHEPNAVRTAAEMQVAHDEVLRVLDLDDVLARRIHLDQRGFAVFAADRDRLRGRADGRDAETRIERIGSAAQDQLVAWFHCGDRGTNVGARADLDGRGRRGQVRPAEEADGDERPV
jgi:hypothetical protein